MKKYRVLGKSVAGLGGVELYKPRNRVADLSEVTARFLGAAGALRSRIHASTKVPVDISWLPAAAKAYKISPDIKDYVVSGVPYITSEYPNRNLQAFTAEEILKFNPKFGMPTYRTFIGKPTFQDHKNDNILQAKGVNLDAIIVPVEKYNVYKIIVLSAFDRTKDRELSEAIIKKTANTYSMGAWVEVFRCSICGEEAVHPICSHFRRIGKGEITAKRELIYQNCHGVEFFEGSSVGDPADLTAVGEEVYTFD